MTIVEFLLARVAEDEASARGTRWLALEYGVDSYGQEAFAARVLAECEAKRRIVELRVQLDSPVSLGDRMAFPSARTAVDLAIRALASVYASHPDYDPAWSADGTGTGA